MGLKAALRLVCGLAAGLAPGWTQIIEFESNGLKYQTLTRNEVTIMVAPLGSQVRGFSLLQVAVSNGSPVSWTIKPEDFSFERTDGSILTAAPVRTVIADMVDKAGRSDVIRLVTAYESTLYGNTRFHSKSGYEVRRQNALAEVSSSKIKAAAAASAIVLVATRLPSGDSTDGAVFWPTGGKPMGTGKVVVRAAGSVFEFPMLSSN